MIMNRAFILPEKKIETKIKEFVINNPVAVLYYEPTIDVSLDGYIPISCGFSTYSISTKCYQCRFISPTQVKMGFCTGDGDMGNLAPGDIGRITVVYLKK